ncbi:MAG: AAA family ATPase [Eubacteriales bacterium]
MISELYIGQYRGIKNLKLDNLGEINIIAGANNVGKTSLLEVIRSLEGPNNLLTWRNIGMRNSIDGRMSFSTYESVINMFPVNKGDEKKIYYSGVKKHSESFSVKVSASMDKIIATKEQIDGNNDNVRWNLENKELVEEFETELLELKYVINGTERGTDIVYELQRGTNRKKNLDKVQLEEKVIYISPTQHTKSMHYLGEILNNTELYEKFIEIMKEFDPYFVSVNAIYNEVGIGKKYVVLSKNHDEGLPLDAYGDGMKKAMLLVCAVLRAKNGILLLDEFETAIHVSAMKSVFEWIIQVARKLNVQIFMTSHSLEAIETVLKVCDKPEDLRMLTLIKRDEEIKVRNVDGTKAIQLLDEYGLELR